MTEAAQQSKSWRDWTYIDWNQRLLNHYFFSHDGDGADVPLENISATPEDLWIIAGCPPDNPDEIAEAFVDVIAAQLPLNRVSFCAFCMRGSWTPVSTDAPHFFAMLWFTCLVAYGYPSTEGGFTERFWALIRKHDNFRYRDGDEQKACLPDLWRQLATWSQYRHDAGNNIRVLVLPQETLHREVIGYSHFLV